MPTSMEEVEEQTWKMVTSPSSSSSVLTQQKEKQLNGSTVCRYSFTYTVPFKSIKKPTDTERISGK